jgi:hypothetical protein
MLRDKTIIKLEAIRYCLDGLIEGKALTPSERGRLFVMRRDIVKMLDQFEGVTYVQSDNVGC